MEKVDFETKMLELKSLYKDKLDFQKTQNGDWIAISKTINCGPYFTKQCFETQVSNYKELCNRSIQFNSSKSHTGTVHEQQGVSGSRDVDVKIDDASYEFLALVQPGDHIYISGTIVGPGDKPQMPPNHAVFNVSGTTKKIVCIKKQDFSPFIPMCEPEQKDMQIKIIIEG